MYLVQVVDVGAVAAGAVALGVFACGFLEPVVRRLLGRWALPIVLLMLGIVRGVAQVSFFPAVDFGLAAAGTVLFLWSLPLMFRSIASAGQESGAHAAVAVLLGLAADTGVKGVFGTMELSWASGVAGRLVTSGLMVLFNLLLILLLWRTASEYLEEERENGFAGAALGYVALGPALFLEMLLFQNVAQQTVYTGWQQPTVFALVMGANLVGVAAALVLVRWDRALPWPVMALLGIALIGAALEERSGGEAALAALTGHAAIAMVLASIVGNAGESSSGRRLSAAIAGGMLLLPVLVFLYYAGFDVEIPVPKEVVPVVAALLVGLAAARGGLAPSSGGASVSRLALLLALALMALPLLRLATWDETPPAKKGLPVRVMTYNIHQGFGIDGSPSLEEIARVIERQDPDIVALQEVSRGWMVNGSVDGLAWLSQRLGMEYAWGPATDSVWGNAVLSRFPIVEHGNQEMPNNDEILLDRAFLAAEIDLGGGETLAVAATHFHAGEDDSALRTPQARTVLEALDVGRATVLMGDLNAVSEDPEIRLIADAGLRDAFASAGATWGLERRRIDYIWTSPDLKVTDFAVHDSPASDHPAVAATLDR